MKRNNRDTTDSDSDDTPNNLPESIIMHEILPRLPVKSLIRFQSVSKEWLAYISSKNSKFVKRHLKFSSSLRPQFLIMKHNRHVNPFYLLPHRKCIVEKYDVEQEFDNDDSYEVKSTDIVDSCNGLVCLYNQVDNPEDCDVERFCFFGVWNPNTRKYDKIDSPPGVHISLAYGFGYVSSLDDYKIVASFATESDDEEDDEYEDEGYVDRVVCRGFYTFSLRSGKWEKIFGNYDYFSRDREWRRINGDSVEDVEKTKLLDYLLQKKGLWHEGIIYWPPCMWSSMKNIVGFDLTSDEFRQYRCTDWLDGYGSVELFRLKGSLALRGNKGNGVTEFWMLKDGGDDLGSDWQKLFSVNLTKVQFLTLSETSKCLVRQSKQLKLVDFSKEALESCGVDGHFNYWGKAIDHVESLVSPFRMTKSEEEEGTKP